MRLHLPNGRSQRESLGTCDAQLLRAAPQGRGRRRQRAAFADPFADNLFAGPFARIGHDTIEGAAHHVVPAEQIRDKAQGGSIVRATP
jgi:hypothetical protein